MALTQLAPPYPIFTDKSGSPLDNGYLYFGEVNKNPETNPIQVFYDSAFTQPAAQPLRTSNGYVMRNGSPALIYAGSQFSVTVRDKNNALVIYSPVGYGIDPGSVTGTVVYDDFIGDGATVAFTLSASPSTKNATNVYIDGVYQSKDNYSTSGSTLTFSTAPPLNSAIEVVTQESSIIGGASSQQITYNQGGAGSVTRTVQSRLRDFVSVKDFGAVGDGVTDDTSAIQAALDTNRDVYFPAGVYLITSGLNEGAGYWLGDGAQRGFTTTPNSNTTMIRCSGSNGGTPFIYPPRKIQGIWFDGVDNTGIGISIGDDDGTFTYSARTFEDVRVSKFDTGILGFNWFAHSWRDVWVDNNIKGINLAPTVTSPDGGYITSTSINGLYVTNNSSYGVNAVFPFGVRTTTAENLVIENNGTAGTFQANFDNFSISVRGLYLEGNSSVPAIKMSGSTLVVDNGYLNGTGGFDLSNTTCKLFMVYVNFVTASDVITNVSAATDIFAAHCNTQTDLTSLGDKVSVFNCVSSGVASSYIRELNKASAAVLSFNRTSTHGDILDLKKDSISVGKLGSYSGLLTIGNGDVGITFNAGGDSILPIDISTNTLRSDAISIGDSTRKFKDLFLQEAVYFKGSVVKWLTGTGSPEGSVTAGVGSLYTRVDGGSGTTLYVKETGAGNTGWAAK